MKNIFALFALLITGSLVAQTLEKVDNKYYLDGTHVYRHELKETLKTNLKALSLYNKARKKESLGGLLLGAGIGLVVADVVKGLVSNETYPSAMTYVGVGLGAISIPVLWNKNKVMDESIKTFNEGTPDVDLGFEYSLDLSASSNGVGLKFTF